MKKHLQIIATSTALLMAQRKVKQAKSDSEVCDAVESLVVALEKIAIINPVAASSGAAAYLSKFPEIEVIQDPEVWIEIKTAKEEEFQATKRMVSLFERLQLLAQA